MKTRIFAFTLLLFTFSCCYSQISIVTPGQTFDNKDLGQIDVDYPYTMTYSAKFKFIDPEKGKMVLNFCKNFENNTIDNAKNLFADRVTIDIPNLKIKGNRDTVFSALKSYRNSLASLKTELDVVMSVKSTDKGDDWVLVWAVDEYTDKENRKHRMKYQQVWLINKEGKISYMEQFDRNLD